MASRVAFKSAYSLFVGSQPVTTSVKRAVVNKYNGKHVTDAYWADAQTVDRAIQLGKEAERPCRVLPSYVKRNALLQLADGIRKRKDEFVEAICSETCKPLRDAETELERSFDTLTVSADEAIRNNGSFERCDISPRNRGFSSIVNNFPIGLISLLTPFNFPLNLVLHKVAPAIAAGCPFLLRPSDKATLTTALLGEELSKLDLPLGSFSILPCTVQDTQPLIADDRVKLVSFTGSSRVGWLLRAQAHKQKLLLELGGICAVIVDEGVTDLDVVAQKIVTGATYCAGQVCLHVQNVYAHRSVLPKLRAAIHEKLIELNKAKGDPLERSTRLGPLESGPLVDRVERIHADAISKGASLLVGGTRTGNFYDATCLENVPVQSALKQEEAFGPIFSLDVFDSFDEVLGKINALPYGLEASVFSQSLSNAFKAYNEIDVGTVVINHIPHRIETLPYGGTKESGHGREGIRYAMAAYSEPRVLLLSGVNGN